MKKVFLALLIVLMFSACEEGSPNDDLLLSEYTKGMQWIDNELLDINVSDLIIESEPIPSKINPDIMVIQPDMFKCPVGNEVIIEPKHGVEYECGGNRFVNYGNSIYILPNINNLTVR